MNKNEKKRLSWKEAVRRTLKSWKLWWSISPAAFLSRLSLAAAEALSPYVTIYLSALLIDELAGSRRPDRIWMLVILTVTAGAGLGLLTAALRRWVNVQNEAEEYLDDKVYCDKMLDLDFQDMDRQETHELYGSLYETVRWTGWGTMLTPVWFGELVTAVFRILGGIALSVSLFTLPVPETAGWLTVLNRPLWLCLIFLALMVISLLPPAFAGKGQSYWSKAAAEWKFGNRFGLFFSRYVNEDRKRAMDLRIYEQQEKVCKAYLAKDASIFMIFQKFALGPMGLWTAASQAVSVILTGLIYLFVCLKAWAGAFGVGAVTRYVGAVTNLFLGLSQLLQVCQKLRTNAEFLEDNLEFLNLPSSMYQGGLTTEKRSDRQYEVEFRDVSFRYPGTETWVLRHVNLKFDIGRRLAVVGENGSGKTTFIKLLCRLYDPTEGTVLLNGIDIRKYRYSDYMKIFSVVFQDFQLLALPLGENVAGSSKYNAPAVSDCLFRVGFGERMNRMDHGLDTYLYRDLDPEGVDVSGGEAQKIAIARALYKDAAFLILDEPTAALDPVTEAEIYSRLNEIAGDRTAVFISHRLSSCRFCDQIAVFHQGEIIQMGTHQQLVSDTEGKYYELWHAQAQYYVV